MDRRTKEKLINFMLQFITETRNDLFENVLSYRTKHITIVLEDIYQPHNASAVLRTCDLTGIQDVHIIENKNKYEVNPDVALGSSKWLNLFKYGDTKDNTITALNQLKKKGYKIIATTPHKNDHTLNDISINDKMALVFGAELNGLSQTAIEYADEFVRIPMYGFTESYNISVSAALILFHLSEKLRSSEIDWQLSEEDKINIKLDWVRKTIKRSEVIEQQFLKRLN